MQNTEVEIEFENGTYMVTGVGFWREEGSRSCPVCGSIMFRFVATDKSQSYYECEYSFMAENPEDECGFRYPGDWGEKDPQIIKLAAERREFLENFREGLETSQIEPSQAEPESAAWIRREV